MAATLAGVCQVPLTAVLLLFELTHDYRIVLPLLGAVGLSSWITSGQIRRDVKETMTVTERSTQPNRQPGECSSGTTALSSYEFSKEESYAVNLCEVESSLCIDASHLDIDDLEKKIFVSEAMRTRYVTVIMSTLLAEVVTLMLTEKQSCAMITDNDNVLIGLMTLEEIQEFSKLAKAQGRKPKVYLSCFDHL